MLPSRPGVVPLSVHVQWKAVFFLYDRRTQTEGMVRDHGTVRQGPEVRILPRDLCPRQTRLHEGRKVDQVGRKKPGQENELRMHRKRKLRVELRIRRHVPITRDLLDRAYDAKKKYEADLLAKRALKEAEQKKQEKQEEEKNMLAEKTKKISEIEEDIETCKVNISVANDNSTYKS